jgi:2-oxoisovalerate dehydrogenase E1 component
VAAELFPTLLRGSATPDISILSYGGMLPVVEQVVTLLEQEEELAVEVLAPSLLSPLPRNTLVGHLLDRPRILVVEETHHEFGVSAEILAALLESGYQGEALRIGTPPVPISAARSLERQILADAEQLINDILDWI